MSGGSSTNNSWTILTPEETVAETLKPLEEGAEHHEDSLKSAAVDPGSGDNPPANGEESAEGPPVEGHLVPEKETAELSGDTSAERHTPVPTAVTDAPVPTSLEASSSLGLDSDALSQSEGLPEGPAQPSPDPDSFSDSYTHITPSPEEPPASLLSTETLGGGEFTQEEEDLAPKETVYPLNGEELQHEAEESDLLSRTPDLGKQADSHVDSEVAEEQTEKLGEEGDPEVRRRRSLLAALERIGKKEEDEEEEFQLPPREEDSGFSLNKCILGAVILLGLGTIFISGVFMDLDEDSDYATRELKDAEMPVKQEWLNPEAPATPVDADNTELLNKLATGNQQISELQAQLQAQEEELKVAKEAAAVGEREHLYWEEVEKENSRLKKEISSIPVLQKENERMKRELESVVALQKELETLRSTVTELKLSQAKEISTPPPGGQTQDSTQGTDGSPERVHKKPWDDQMKKKKDMKKDEKYKTEREKSGRKEGDKTEWKKGKSEQKFHAEETKQRKEKDWKKDKARRGDEGKSWKDREGKKEWKDKDGRKEWKEEKGWKKGKHEKVNEGKQWRGKEEKRNWEVGRDHGEKFKGKEWKGEKEWKKGKGSGKERWDKTDWKEKGERKEWKKDSDFKSGGSKKGERKQWEESRSHGKDRKEKNERKQWNEKEWKGKNEKVDKAWKKDEKKQWEKKEEKWKQKENKNLNFNHGDEEHLWGDRKHPHSHRKPSLDQPEYWAQQRDHLQHLSKPLQHCNTPESCAQMEGLILVTLPEFEAILQTYLTKAEDAGVDESKREELKKLTAEFFKDGVFVHDQMSFQEFVEDVGDILEDMVEGDEDEEEEDSALEDEMEGFEKEVMQKFSVPEKEERSKGEWRKESVRGHG